VINKDAAHHNILEKYYGKDWELKPVEGLGDHYD
jgi:3'-phosphoadenosine 5'-phosphosulfate sulfotransferase